jgi:hypothetical protein
VRTTLAIESDALWTGSTLSGLLHLGVIALIVFGLPRMMEPLEPASYVPVTVISPQDLDDLRIATTPIEDIPETVEETPETAAVEPPPLAEEPPPVVEAQDTPLPAPTEDAPPAPALPEPSPPPSKPVPQEAVPLPEPEAVAAAEPEPVKPPDPLPAETPEAPPEEEPLLAEVMPPVPQPRPLLADKAAEPEPKPVVKAPEQPKDPLAAILRNVQTDLKQDQPKSAPASTQVASAGAQRQINQLVRMIRSQVSRCWRIDAGAQSADDLRISIRVRLKPDGSVLGQPEFQNLQQLMASGYHLAAAENARRAILDCQPFSLPAEHYRLWSDLILIFDPREML